MPKGEGVPSGTPPSSPPREIGRRRFLASLGILAGAGALAPILRSVPFRAPGTFETGRPALGTWVKISIRGSDPARAARAAQRAFDAIRVVDAQMSVHRGDSQLSRVNAAAGRSEVHADPAMLDVMRLADDAARRSGGVYDPTILPLMRLYGFYESGRKRWPSDREIASTLDVTGFRHVRLDPGAHALGLDRAGAALDLGSIGKGWALDRAADALRAEGIDCGLVDVGGNVYGIGAPEDEPAGWPVGVAHPLTGRIERIFRLRDTAVATSGNTEQYRVLAGVRVGHLFDARSGRPADGHLSASVQARTGVESDYLSTVAFLLGPGRFPGSDWPEALAAHFVG